MLPLHATQEALFLTMLGVGASDEQVDAVQESLDGDAMAQRSEDPAEGNWLSRLLDRIEARAWERERRAMDDYLADASDLVDLEQRMRRYDRRFTEGSAMFRGN